MKAKKVLFTVSAVMFTLSPVLASAADDSANTTINATIASVISMTTSGTVAISITPTSGGSASSASDTVTVNTNHTGGYNLTLANGDATLTLAGSNGGTIAAHGGTYASPSTLATNTWGYRVDNAGTFGAGPTTAQTNQTALDGTWAGVPASGSAQLIKTTGTIATDDVTTVWYGVEADTSKTNGVYSDAVTYTATTN